MRHVHFVFNCDDIPEPLTEIAPIYDWDASAHGLEERVQWAIEEQCA